MTHYYPEDQSSENLKKIRLNNVCSECGRQLSEYLNLVNNKIYIACSGRVHQGIAREYQPPIEDYESNMRREHEMQEKRGTGITKEIANIPRQGQLTQDQAMTVLRLVYPDVPDPEIIRTAILCRDYGLHPLMKEVYIIPFKDKTGNKTWSTVLGINATRKIMSRYGTYSYIGNTPRIMTEEEQMAIFGEIDSNNIVAITKLRTKEGLEAPGYGRWTRNKEPYGTDKGNTKANMAFIRSERNAFGRLFTDALPVGVEVIDETYMDKETGEIVAGSLPTPDALPPAAKTESSPSAAEISIEGHEGEKVLDFDPVELQEQLAEVKWAEGTAKSYCQNVYKVNRKCEPLDANLNLIDFIASLKKQDREAFFMELSTRLY